MNQSKVSRGCQVLWEIYIPTATSESNLKNMEKFNPKRDQNIETDSHETMPSKRGKLQMAVISCSAEAARAY